LSEYRQQLADRVQVDLARKEKEISLRQAMELKNRAEKANSLMTLQLQSAKKSLQTNKVPLISTHLGGSCLLGASAAVKDFDREADGGEARVCDQTGAN